MFIKRKFVKEFCREQDGENFYTISDESGNEVFVGRIFKDQDATAILNLVQQAYNIGVADLASHISETMKFKET